MTTPLVSVIIPTYNRAGTIVRCLDSVFEQTYRSMEVIVVDDGSVDETVELIKKYGDKVTLICQPNGGPSSARNTGFATARGEIIAFLDSDDTWKPDKLERQVRLMMLGGSTVPCCVCNATIMSNNGTSNTSFRVSDVESRLAEGYWLNPVAIIATRFLLFNQVVAIRRDAFESIGGFNENMRLLEDYDLAFRLALLGPWAFVSEALVEKYNDSEGIGVIAMRDPTVHVKAWVDVVGQFLDQPIETGGDVERYIKRSVKDGTIAMRAVNLIQDGGPLAYTLARLLRASLRIKGIVRRRLPSWPRVNAVVNLEC